MFVICKLDCRVLIVYTLYTWVTISWSQLNSLLVPKKKKKKKKRRRKDLDLELLFFKIMFEWLAASGFFFFFFFFFHIESFIRFH